VVRVLLKESPKLVNLTYVPGFSMDRMKVLWAVSMVKSRQFGGIVDKREKYGGKCLVPVVDCFNHARDPGTTPLSKVSTDGQVLGYRAVQHIERGSHVSVSYGNHSLESLVINYGFTAEDAPPMIGFALLDDLKKIIGSNDALKHLKHRVFRANGCVEVEPVAMKKTDVYSEFLLPCSRSLELTDEDLKKVAQIWTQTDQEENKSDSAFMEAAVQIALIMIQDPLPVKQELQAMHRLGKLHQHHIVKDEIWSRNVESATLLTASVQPLMEARQVELRYHNKALQKILAVMAVLVPELDEKLPNKKEDL